VLTELTTLETTLDVVVEGGDDGLVEELDGLREVDKVLLDCC